MKDKLCLRTLWVRNSVKHILFCAELIFSKECFLNFRERGRAAQLKSVCPKT